MSKIQKQPPEVQKQWPEAFYKKGVFKNFVNLTGIFNKVAGLEPASFFKKDFKHNCFPVKFAKLLRTPILKNICKRLLLEVFYKKLFLKTLQYSQDESS